MGPSKDEIRFAKQRQQIWRCICETCEKVEKAFDVSPSGVSANLDSLVGSLQNNTISGQQMTMKRSYRSVAGFERSFEISVGHTGTNWQAIATIRDEGSSVYTMNFGTDSVMNFSELKADIYRRIEACSQS
jgi:hypothetical protein